MISSEHAMNSRAPFVSIRASADQLKLLRTAFAHAPNLPIKQLEELSMQTGLSEKWIKSWFVRERKKTKSSILPADITAFKSEYLDVILPSDSAQQQPLKIRQRAKHETRRHTSVKLESEELLTESFAQLHPPQGEASFPDVSLLAPVQSLSDCQTIMQTAFNHFKAPQPSSAAGLPVSLNTTPQDCSLDNIPSHTHVKSCNSLLSTAKSNIPNNNADRQQFRDVIHSNIYPAPALPYIASTSHNLFLHKYSDNSHNMPPTTDVGSSPHGQVTVDTRHHFSQASETSLAIPNTPAGSESHVWGSITSVPPLTHTPTLSLSMSAFTDAQDITPILEYILDPGLPERDPFQAAMGLVSLARLGWIWDY